MRFIVIRLKYVIFGLITAAVIAGFFIFRGNAVMTFLSGGRELPIYSVERSDNKLALTFDCAWNNDDIDSIISTLEQYNCRATFFVTGKWAEEYSDSLNKLYRAGFEIGAHSYNHADYTKMSSEEIERDLEKCDNAILKTTGTRASVVRAPSGAYNDIVIKTIENGGRPCIQWSVDGLDYPEDATTESIIQRVTDKAGSGDIILLHNGTTYTADALPEILKTLRSNYELVNVSELIYNSNFTLDHTGKQRPNDML